MDKNIVNNQYIGGMPLPERWFITDEENGKTRRDTKGWVYRKTGRKSLEHFSFNRAHRCPSDSPRDTY